MDGGDDIDTHHDPKPVTDGELKGWLLWDNDAYETHVGPFYFRVEEDGSVRCAFRAAKTHMNGAGTMHGGCLMTFADFCLFAISHPVRTKAGAVTPMVTVSLNGEFVGPVLEGDLVESRGEVLRAGGSLTFLRGIIETGGRPAMTFSGVIKTVKRRPV